jgi:hypothetical protein
MARRSAAAYALVLEAIAFVHEQNIGLARDERDQILFNQIAATRYLRMLLLALRKDIDRADAGAASLALADLGSRHRPRLKTDTFFRIRYLDDLIRSASREVEKVRTFCRMIGERDGPVLEALDEVAMHLGKAEALLNRSSSRTGRPPDGDEFFHVAS